MGPLASLEQEDIGTNCVYDSHSDSYGGGYSEAYKTGIKNTL